MWGVFSRKRSEREARAAGQPQAPGVWASVVDPGLRQCRRGGHLGPEVENTEGEGAAARGWVSGEKG